MNTTEEPVEKVKLSRAELLAKAREAKAKKAKERQEQGEEKPKKTKSKTKETPIVEYKELSINEKEVEPEIVEEVVRVPANRKKKIVKRTIEIEESETDEEIVEEIVKIPKMKKEVKISRDEMKKKLIETNKQRLHNELFS